MFLAPPKNWFGPRNSIRTTCRFITLTGTGSNSRDDSMTPSAEFKRGLDIDPTNLIVNAELANAYYFAHQFDSAITQCRKTLDLDPTFEVATVWLAQTY